MRRVIIESPFAADTPQGIVDNIKYARLCMKDCFERGEAPFASHLLYTQPDILTDNIVAERELGIRAGLEWGEAGEATVVYVDKGVSKGMELGIEEAKKQGRTVEYRWLDKDENAKKET